MNKIVIAMIVTTGIVQASPRTDYIEKRIEESYRVEVQVKDMLKGVKQELAQAEDTTKYWKRELKDTRQRENAEDALVREQRARSMRRINPYLQEDTSYPVSAKVVY